MAFKWEPLTQGLVTSKDPSTLDPGEFAAAAGCFYYDDIDSLCRAPALYQWAANVTGNQPVKGLVNCSFDNGNNYLVAQASGFLSIADAETDGSSFATAVSGLTTTSKQLHSVQMDNRYYIMNGTDLNKVMLQDGTFRQHGLQPVSTAPISNGVLASAFSGSATGFYQYWYTEVVTFSDGQELESTYNAQPISIQVTNVATTAPSMTLPTTPANPRVGTKIRYRIYRSEAMVLASDSLYPIGRKVEDIGVVVDNNGTAIGGPIVYTDSSVSLSTGNKTATNQVADVGIITTHAGNVVNTFGGGAASNFDALLSTADAKTVICTLGASPVPGDGTILSLYGFSLGTLGSSVVGITVSIDVACTVANTATLWVSVGERNATSGLTPFRFPAPSKEQFLTSLYTPGTPPFGFIGNSRIALFKPISATGKTTYTFGSATNSWIPGLFSWPVSQFGSDFEVQIGIVFNGTAVATNAVTLHSLALSVNYSGTSNDKIGDRKLYDAVIVEEDGIELKFGANGLPPIASTGTVFEGSLVTNDVANPRRVVWSTPGGPDAFPNGVYWEDLPTPDGDTITFMAQVNNRLVVGCKGSLWRINYLPNQADASFQKGRAVERISDRLGILNPKSACVFQDEQGHQSLAFVDSNGLFMTDAYAIRSMSKDIRWVSSPTGVFIAISSSIYTTVIGLLNDPGTQTLRLVISNGYYSLSYAANHIKQNGQPKWAGLNDIRFSSKQPKSACVIRRSNGVWIPVFGYDGAGGAGGFIYREDANDSTILHNNTRTMTITTRDIFPTGDAGEAQLSAIILKGRARGDAFTSIEASLAASLTVTEIHEGQAANNLAVLNTAAVDGSYFSDIGVIANARGYRIAISFTDTGMNEVQGLLLRLTDFGEAEHLA